jgi:hypothetical protein
MRRILFLAPTAITTGLPFAGPALAQQSAADGPESGPEGLGFRLVCTLLFPK